MKKQIFPLCLVFVFLASFFAGNGQPPSDPLQVMQNDINAGRAKNETYKKCRDKAIEAANNALNNPTDPAMLQRFIESLNRQIQAAVALAANRNKVITDAIAHFGLVVPPGQQITYDINCKGECVHGYCSLECPIGICEKAFNPQPWGGGGTPAWVSAIIKHELEHKKQINPGPPPSWNDTEAEGEYDAWQAALKCAETSGLSDTEKQKILDIKKYWDDRKKAEAAAASLIRSISEWLQRLFAALKGSVVPANVNIKNYSDYPEMVTCTITNQKNWQVEPNVIPVYLEPGQEISYPVMIHVPDTAVINTKNEFFCGIETPEGPVTDFMFIVVDPNVTVTPPPDMIAHRGETVPVMFMVENNINANPDTVMIELTNPLGWPVNPPLLQTILMPGEQYFFMSLMTIPPELPHWMTNIAYCRATSLNHPEQTEQKRFAVRISENDVCALLINAPLGDNPEQVMITPGAWVFNPGLEDSFFDFFVNIDFPQPYSDSVNGIILAPGQDISLSFTPVIPVVSGDYHATFYARLPLPDATPDNDTVAGTFTVSIPATLSLQNLNVESGEHCFEALQSITTGGAGTVFVVHPGANVHLVAGNQITMLPFTNFLYGSSGHSYIDPGGLFCSSIRSPALISTGSGYEVPPADNAQIEGSFFRVWPNPTSGDFTVAVKGDPGESECVVEVFGIMGDRILCEKLPSPGKSAFSISWKPSGIYLLRVTLGKQSGLVKLLKL